MYRSSPPTVVKTADSELLAQANKQIDALQSELIDTQVSMHQMKRKHEEEITHYKNVVDNVMMDKHQGKGMPSSSADSIQNESPQSQRNDNKVAADAGHSSSSPSPSYYHGIGDSQMTLRTEIKSLQLQLKHAEEDVQTLRRKFEDRERECRMLALERDSIQNSAREAASRAKAIDHERLTEIEKMCDQLANLEIELQIAKSKSHDSMTEVDTTINNKNKNNNANDTDDSAHHRHRQAKETSPSSLSSSSRLLKLVSSPSQNNSPSSTNFASHQQHISSSNRNHHQGVSSSNMQQIFALQTENDSLKLRAKNAESKLEQAQIRIEEQNEQIRTQQDTIRRGTFEKLSSSSSSSNNINNKSQYQSDIKGPENSSSIAENLRRELSDALSEARRYKHAHEESQRINSQLVSKQSSLRLQLEHFISDNANLEQQLLQAEHSRELLKHHVDALLKNQKQQRDERASSSSSYFSFLNNNNNNNKNINNNNFLKHQEEDLKQMLILARAYDFDVRILSLQQTTASQRLEQEQLRFMNNLYLERCQIVEQQLADSVNGRMKMESQFKLEKKELRMKIDELEDESRLMVKKPAVGKQEGAASPSSFDENIIDDNNISLPSSSSWAPLPMIQAHLKIRQGLESQLKELNAQVVRTKIDSEILLSNRNATIFDLVQTNLFSLLEESQKSKQMLFEVSEFAVLSTKRNHEIIEQTVCEERQKIESRFAEKERQLMEELNKMKKNTEDRLKQQDEKEHRQKNLFGDEFGGTFTQQQENNEASTSTRTATKTITSSSVQQQHLLFFKSVIQQIQTSTYESFKSLAELVVGQQQQPQALQSILQDIKTIASKQHEEFYTILHNNQAAEFDSDDDNTALIIINLDDERNRRHIISTIRSSFQSLQDQWKDVFKRVVIPRTDFDQLDLEQMEAEERSEIMLRYSDSLLNFFARKYLSSQSSVSSHSNNNDFDSLISSVGSSRSTLREQQQQQQRSLTTSSRSSRPSSSSLSPPKATTSSSRSNVPDFQQLLFSPQQQHHQRQSGRRSSPSTAAATSLLSNSVPQQQNRNDNNNNINDDNNSGNNNNMADFTTNDENVRKLLLDQERSFSRNLSALSHQTSRTFTASVLQLKRDLSSSFFDFYGDFLDELAAVKRDATYVMDILPMRKERDAALAELAQANRAAFDVLDSRKDLQAMIDELNKKIENEILLKSQEQEKSRTLEMELRSAKERILKMEGEATDLRFALHQKQKSDNDKESTVVSHLSEQQRSLMKRAQELERDKMALELRLGDIQAGQLAMSKRTKAAEEDAEEARDLFEKKDIELNMRIGQMNKLKQECEATAERAEHLKALLDQESLKLEQANREAEEWRSTAQDLQRRIEVDENLMKNIMGGGSPGWLNSGGGGTGGGLNASPTSTMVSQQQQHQMEHQSLQHTSSFLLSGSSTMINDNTNNDNNNTHSILEEIAMKNSEKALVETQVQRARLEARIDAAKAEGAKSVTDLRRIWEQKEQQMKMRELKVQEQQERLDAFCESVQSRMAFATNSEREYRHRCDVLIDMNDDLRKMCGLFIRKLKQQRKVLRSWETKTMARFDPVEFPKNHVACQHGERGRLEISAMASASSRFAAEIQHKQKTHQEIIHNSSRTVYSASDNSGNSNTTTSSDLMTSSSSSKQHDTTSSTASRVHQQMGGRDLLPLVLEAFQTLNDTEWFGIPAIHFLFLVGVMFGSFVMGNVSKSC